MASDSPKLKKRKGRKSRVSPNNFAINYQKRYPPGMMNQIHHSKRVSLEHEDLTLISKSRPKSAKQKKKIAKAASKISKLPVNSFMGGESFDKDDKSLSKFMKKHNCSFKARPGSRPNIDSKKRGQKLKQFKQSVPKNGNLLAYENMSYIEDLEMHNNIDDIVKSKLSLKYKAKKPSGSKKKKAKRSATPALAINY